MTPLNVRARLLMTTLIILFCVGVDQVTKSIATASLAGSPPRSFLGNTVRLEYAENHGAFLSMGAGLSDGTRYLLFVVFVGLALSITLFFIFKARSVQRQQLTGLSLITAGGIGNLIDRVANDGAVIDFMNVGIGTLRTGIFNVADMAIMAGMVMLMIYSLHPKPSEIPGAEIPVAKP